MNLDISSMSAEGLLTLLGLKGIGPQTAERLASRFRTLGQIRDASPRDFQPSVSGELQTILRKNEIWEKAFSQAQKILEKAERIGVRVLTIAEEKYPIQLRCIPDRPPVLYVKGHLKSGRRYVACIGTREPSRFGVEATKGIVKVLSTQGWSIVSGLAMGVDALAHQTALENKGYTIAILANGLDSVYPKKNSDLAENILADGGALISEQPFDTPAIPRNLVQRDRLQSGMSVGTIVMQTGISGGSMHTVRFTLMQNRLLFTPLPQGRYVKEPMSQGILALTQKTGRDLSRLLRANADYAQLLQTKFATRSVSIPITSREDYTKLLQLLEKAVETSPKGQTEKCDAQLDLFE